LPDLAYDRVVTDREAIRAWIRRNEAARAEDRRRDAQRSMSETPMPEALFEVARNVAAA
jgi:hypothetical protein